MPEQTNNPNQLLRQIDNALHSLAANHSFQGTQAVINAVIALLGVSGEPDGWRLFSDSAGKIRSNGHWFMPADGYADRRAVYEVAKGNDRKLDFKTYWVQNTNKSVIHWVTAITPNFEDAPWLASENVGIDFVIPEKADRVFVVLSKEHALRVIELRDRLSPTASEIFSKWTQPFNFSNKAQLHQILWDSFNFEAINKVFYKTISSFFTELKQHLLSKSKDLFDDHSAALFVNRLIGRIIFCWFIDKKGILNTEVNYFQTNGLAASEHYRTKLETLFFRILNTPVDERISGLDIKTPFLNGGLFEAKTGDHEGDVRVSFPADYFDRLYEFLRRYNFTTDESSSTFQQVAIDPEMLGRIFENLLAEQIEETGEQARKAKGAFYTPREIVDYMCKESLREYLRSRIPETTDRDEQLAKLLDKKPHEFRDQQRNYRGDLKPYKHDILEALEELTVLDPACGSGAFPMGMLQLLLETYDRLESDYDPYKKKLTIIKNNIFGVDIEPMAVEIARLRAWLSIIVDEDVSDGRIEPLPNLDFKFVCANSLMPLDHAEGLYDTLKEDQLIEIRDEYFRARKHSRKQELREKFETLVKGKNGMDGMFSSDREKQLKTYQPFNAENTATFFDPQIMFGIENGFGVVIGNPPYVQLQKMKISEVQRASYASVYSTYEKRGDLYCLFYERGANLLSKGGIISYITSNSWLRTLYGKSLRKFLVTKADPFILINIENAQVFEAATVEACIFFARKGSWQGKLTGAVLTSEQHERTSLANFVEKNSVNIEKLDEQNGWLVGNEDSQNLKQKIDDIGKPVKELGIRINFGIKTGYNQAFIFGGTVREEIVRENPQSAELIKPILRGRNVQKFFYEFGDEWMFVIPSGWTDLHRGDMNPEEFFKTQHPSIYSYLQHIGATVKAKGKGLYDREDQGKYWWELRSCDYYDDFVRPKIIWGELSDEPKFAFDDQGYFAEATLFILTGEHLKFLVAVLNSALGKWYFEQISTTSGMGTNRWKKYKIEILPVVVPNDKDESELISLVDRLTDLRKDHGSSDVAHGLENEINEKIFNLYGITDKEKRIIEGSGQSATPLQI